MVIKKEVATTVLYGMTAILVEPLLSVCYPSLKPLVNEVIQSKEITEFLRGLTVSAGAVSSNVFANFLHANADKLLKALRHSPKLDEALIAALIQAFEEMRDDLRKRNQHRILNSFDQFFADWENKLREIQADEFRRREFLETKHMTRVFYEAVGNGVTTRDWWPPLKSTLEAWTNYASIPPDLESYLEEKILAFAQGALTSTLHSEGFKAVWDEFHLSLEKELLSTLRRLERHVLALKELAMVSGGQFIQNERSIDFVLRHNVDALLERLSARDIYIQRKTLIGRDATEIKGLKDILTSDGYFLLAAPAGSGKSTLMARWIREINSAVQNEINEPEAKICYYFYSKHDGTSDYLEGLTVLSEQLLKANNIRANVKNINSATIRSIIPTALELEQKTRLIVIVDGLDEAGDPSTATELVSLFRPILPRILGRNITVILTLRDDEGARSLEHYTEELDLPFSTIQLLHVSEDALASYLSGSTNDKLAKRAQDRNFIRGIITRTGGLAIYLHYLLDELGKAREERWEAMLQVLPKKFEKYVSRSLSGALNDRRNWEEALSFLALTESPLAEQDLIALTELTGNRVKKMDFDGMGWNLKRWLRNDRDSWSFSHQQIGAVFYHRYVANNRSTFSEHLLSYCAAWEQHEPHSHYALGNYAGLLRRQLKDAALYDLAGNKQFLTAQRDLLRDQPSAALRTLQEAMLLAAAKDNAAMMARFSLAHATMVGALTAPSWVDTYERRGLLGTLELADYLHDESRKVIWYLLTATKLLTENRKLEGEGVLKRFLNTFTPVRDELDAFKDLAENLLPPLAMTFDCKLVSNVYSKILSERRVDPVNAAVVDVLIPEGDTFKAKRIADEIVSKSVRASALVRVALALESKKLAGVKETLSEALQDAKAIPGAERRINCLIEAANALIICGFRKDASDALVEIIGDAQKLVVDDYHSEAQERARTLWRIGQKLVQADDRQNGERVFDLAIDNYKRTYNFETMLGDVESFATVLIEAGFPDKAESLKGVVSVEKQGKVVAETTKAFIQIGEKGQAEQLLLEAETVIGNASVTDTDFYSHFGYYREGLLALSRVWAVMEERDKALQLVTDAERIVWEAEKVVDKTFEEDVDEDYRYVPYGKMEHVESLASLSSAWSEIGFKEKAEQLLDVAQAWSDKIENISTGDALHLSLTLGNASRNLHEDGKSIVSENSKPYEDEDEWVAKTSINAEEFESIARDFSQYEEADCPKGSELLVGHGDISPLGEIADALVKVGFFKEAKSLATGVKSVQVLASSAVALYEAGAKGEAEDLLLMLKEVGSRDNVSDDELTATATALIATQHFTDALTIANYIKSEGGRLEIAITLAMSDRVDEAMEIIDGIDQHLSNVYDFAKRVEALAEVAISLSRQGEEVRATELFIEAEDRARDTYYKDVSAIALSRIAIAFARVGKKNEADAMFTLAKELPYSFSCDYDDWVNSNIEVGRALVRARRYEEAIEYTKHNIFHDDILMKVAVALSSEQKFAESEETTQLLKNNEHRTSALCRLAVDLVRSENICDATRVTDELTWHAPSLIEIHKEIVKTEHPALFEQYLVIFSGKADIALRACAQMMLSHKGQARNIYNEVKPYVASPRPIETLPAQA